MVGVYAGVCRIGFLSDLFQEVLPVKLIKSPHVNYGCSFKSAGTPPTHPPTQWLLWSINLAFILLELGDI